jgi:RNA polymerase sigma factor (sigma-70 family)
LEFASLSQIQSVATYQLFQEQAETIDAVLQQICRGRRLTVDICEEFSSWVRLRLLEGDSVILRKFAGRSSARTYLMTVIKRLYLDWRNKEWGKWRPSTAARRQGPLAIELERLVLRDRVPFEEAVEHLCSRGIADSREQCETIWAGLPQRPSRRNAPDEELENAAAPPVPDALTVDEHNDSAARTASALTKAIAMLDAADHLILRLRFADGFTVARIAQVIGHDQRALYRRFDHVMSQLRAALLAHGVSASDIVDLLGSPNVDFSAYFRFRPGNQE